MADTSELEKMGRELTCPICLSLLKYAVSLTCNHIFCNHCIQKSMKSDSSCPVCKVPFRPREIHPAPNIDNMVSIYKRMEAASGISIFVTQNGPDEQKKAEGGGNSGGTCKEREDNGKKTKAKQCKKFLQTNQKNSGTYPVNPSFPTKKRVQVPQYPHSGTPTRPAASKRESYEPTKDGPMDGSTVLKEKPALNENGEVVFSPFFWLRDDEDAEKMSQRTDVDHLMDMPTPNVPSFSDIKDSDDDFASKMTPTVAAPRRSNMENLYDSEMFEWTQRACSPELRSSPTTLQVVDTDELNGNQEPDNMISPSISLGQGTHATYGELPHIPSPSTKIDNDQERIRKSNKTGRKASESAQRKCTKSYTDNVFGKHVGLKEVAETQEQTCEHNETSSNLKKAAKRTKVAHCDSGASELSRENVPTIPVISDGELPRISSPRIKIANIQDGVTKSNKRERKASESAQRTCTKSRTNKVLGNHVGLKVVAETREQICEHNETLSNFKKVAKRTKVAHCDAGATGLSPANVPSIPVVPDGELSHMSSPRTKVANNQEGLKNSNKRDRKVSERAQRKCTKSNRDEVLGMHIDSKEVVGSSELSTEDVSMVPVGPKCLNQADGNVVIKRASLSIKQGRDEGFNSKKIGRSLKKIKIQNLKDCPLRSEDLRPDASKVNTLENAPLNKKQRVLMSAIDPKSAPELRKKTKACYDNQQNLKSTIDPKSAPELRKKSRSCYDVQRNLKSAIDPKSAPELRKRSKACLDDISKDDLVDSVQKCNSKVVAKDTHPIKKALGKSEFNVLNNLPTMEKSLPLMNGVALRKCVNIPNKFQCAFCHSPDNLKVSGELVHYFNGKPVAADHNGGANVILSHKSCTEWAPNVYFEDDMAINLEAEIARSRRIKCSFCGIKGAALGCYEKSCRRSFHVPCAKSTPQCRWDTENFVILCPIHASSKLPNEIPESQVKQRKHRTPKGQSPTQLAQVSPKHTPNWHWNSRGSSDKIVLCCSALTIEEKEIMSEFEKLTGVTDLKKWSSSVTHVIASTDENGTCRRTLKILMGILEGKWILSIEWIKACMRDMKHVDEESYEIGVDIHGIKNGPRLGRLRLINKEPKLFQGFKFYFTGDFIPSYKGYLHDLIIAAGGSVLHRKPIPQDQEALFSGSSTGLTFIIYSVELLEKSDSNKKDLIFKQRRLDAESLARTSGAKVVSNTWVLNSIAGHKLENDGE